MVTPDISMMTFILDKTPMTFTVPVGRGFQGERMESFERHLKWLRESGWSDPVSLLHQ
jgi:hypothetical protein